MIFESDLDIALLNLTLYFNLHGVFSSNALITGFPILDPL
jgi:hypothetical protein